MAQFNESTNMDLPIPVSTETTGPEYANYLNQCLTQIDQHDHTSGKGVPINPSGISINADLPFTSSGIFYNATDLRSVRFNANTSPLALGTDIGCVYVSGVDLYYNDVNGTQIRMTQSGSIAGSPGSITGLTPPANVTYSSINQTFTFQSSTATAASIDAGSYTLRNLTANSAGITLSPPATLASNYTLTFPTGLPTTGSILRVDPSGNISSTLRPDGSTIIIASSALQVPRGGIQPANLASLNVQASTSSGQFTTTFAGWLPVCVSSPIVVSGQRPIMCRLISDGTSGNGSAGPSVNPDNNATIIIHHRFTRNGVPIDYGITGARSATTNFSFINPPCCYSAVDLTPGPSSAYTYTFDVVGTGSAGGQSLVDALKLQVFEM